MQNYCAENFFLSDTVVIQENIPDSLDNCWWKVSKSPSYDLFYVLNQICCPSNHILLLKFEMHITNCFYCAQSCFKKINNFLEPNIAILSTLTLEKFKEFILNICLNLLINFGSQSQGIKSRFYSNCTFSKKISIFLFISYLSFIYLNYNILELSFNKYSLRFDGMKFFSFDIQLSKNIFLILLHPDKDISLWAYKILSLWPKFDDTLFKKSKYQLIYALKFLNIKIKFLFDNFSPGKSIWLWKAASLLVSLFPNDLELFLLNNSELYKFYIKTYKFRVTFENIFPIIKKVLGVFDDYNVFKKEIVYDSMDFLLEKHSLMINEMIFSEDTLFSEIKDILFIRLKSLNNHPLFYNICTSATKKLIIMDVDKEEKLVKYGLELILLLLDNSTFYPKAFIEHCFPILLKYLNCKNSLIVMLSIKIITTYFSVNLVFCHPNVPLILETLDLFIQFFNSLKPNERYNYLCISYYLAISFMRYSLFGIHLESRRGFDSFSKKLNLIDEMFILFFGEIEAFSLHKYFNEHSSILYCDIFILTILLESSLIEKIDCIFKKNHKQKLSKNKMIELASPEDMKWIKEAIIVTLIQAASSKISLDEPVYERLVESVEELYENKMNALYFIHNTPKDIINGKIDIDFVSNIWKLYYIILKRFSEPRNSTYIPCKIVSKAIGGAWRIAKFALKQNCCMELMNSYITKSLVPIITISLYSDEDRSKGCQLLLELVIKIIIKSGVKLDITIEKVKRIYSNIDSEISSAENLEKVYDILDLYLKAQEDKTLLKLIMFKKIPNNTVKESCGSLLLKKAQNKSKLNILKRKKCPQLWINRKNITNPSKNLEKMSCKPKKETVYQHQRYSKNISNKNTGILEYLKSNNKPPSYLLCNTVLSWNIKAIIDGSPCKENYTPSKKETIEDYFNSEDFIKKYTHLIFLEIWASLEKQLQISGSVISGVVSDLDCKENYAYLKISLDSTFLKEIEEEDLILISLKDNLSNFKNTTGILAICKGVKECSLYIKCELCKLEFNESKIRGQKVRIVRIMK